MIKAQVKILAISIFKYEIHKSLPELPNGQAGRQSNTNQYHQVVNARKLALKEFIVNNDIDAKYLIPTNTSKTTGYEDICTMEMLDSTIKFGIKPNEVADFFQSKSLEYLENKRDSLSKEFKKIPKYYDYYQCGKALIKR